MAEAVGRDGGGIGGLLDALDEFQEAIEYDLISLGLRLDWLGSEALSWRDLFVVVRQSPPSSALRRAVGGEDAEWDLFALLLAEAVDSLHIANWQRTGKDANRPEPIPRPGVRPERDNYQSMTVEETLEWLGWPNPN